MASSSSNKEVLRLSCACCGKPLLNAIDDPKVHDSSARFLVYAHEIQSKSFVNEIKLVFPSVDSSRSFIVVGTLQRSDHDLAGLGDSIEREKDRLLESVIQLLISSCDNFDNFTLTCPFGLVFCFC